ncbi:hypothetical protein [Rhodococcus koreensis]|uniref:hypothetical protein n=1 Tax=Rhodococcus koreensis TaxID=99653 RepID=UPI00366F36CB
MIEVDRATSTLSLAALSGRGPPTPKGRDGLVESMRILLAERSSARKAPGAAMNQIRALLVTAPRQIRGIYRNLGSVKLVAALSRSRRTPGHGPERTLRGGDRTANSAIHRIVLVQMSAGDTRTVDCIARCTAEGKSEREIIHSPQTLRRARGFQAHPEYAAGE